MRRHPMIIRSLAGFPIPMLVAAWAPTTALAEEAGPPKELYGKSIVTSWREDRVQHQLGKGKFHPESFGGGLVVYVGTEGHVFARIRMSNLRRGKGGAEDRIGDDDTRSISFDDHALTFFRSTGPRAHGARRVAVTFDDTFATCAADAGYAKEQGYNTIITTSMIDPGRIVEIRSVKVSGVSCAVKDGNAFAPQ